MAESKKEFIEVDALGRQWLRQGLQTERTRLVRLRAKELVGSEIYGLRSKEIQAVDELIARV